MTKSEKAVVTAFTTMAQNAMAQNAIADDAISGFGIRVSKDIIELMIEKSSPLLGDKNPMVQVQCVRKTLPIDPKAARVQAIRMCGVMRDKLESEYLRRVRGGEVPA